MDKQIERRQMLQGIGTIGAFGLMGTQPAGAEGREPFDRHIVGIEPGKADIARRAADEVYRELDFGDIGQAVSGWFSEEALDGLRNNPNVRYIEAEGEMEAIEQDLPWGVDRVDADVAHTNGETGGDDGGDGGDGNDDPPGANIAIIDTGIDSDHPDLKPNLGTGYAVVSARGPYTEKWDDDEGHGTHCAGIADAVDNTEGVVGVSTAATLHAVKVLDSSGSGSFSDIAEGIRWVADQGYDVGSMSLGASSGSSTVKDACQYAVDNGVFLVAAAGNSGPCTDCVGYPAAYEAVVAVSSTTKDDTLSEFSSTGPEVELAAPGSNIYSTYAGGGYETLNGTSMACPHVSGAGGQLMDNGYSNTEARDQLNSTAEDIGLSSEEQGNGLLDVEAAVLGGDNSPAVSWGNPTNGEEVAGTITVQIEASDSEDNDNSLDVTYSIDGGSERSTSYDSDSGYYEDSWDTTGVDDGDHTLAADATDSAGNTATASITVTTNNTESPPAVDSLSLTEVETSDSDAEFDADWSVSDPDGNLSSVDLVLTQEDNSTEDSASNDVSGDTASGTTRLVAAGDDGSGNSYTVECTVTDGAENTASATASATETEDTENAPTIDSYTVTEAGSPNPHAEITADWDVGDADGNLKTVTIEVINADNGSVADSVSHDVGGSDATGTDQFKIQQVDGETFDVTLTVTDTVGNSTSATETVTE